MANKKENIKNLVKRMFLSISIMSFFVSAGVDNASAMEQNSIFGEAHKRKSDNSQQNTAPISAPMATLSAKQDNSGYRLAVPDSPISDKNTGVSGGSLIFEQGLNKDPDANNNKSIFDSLKNKNDTSNDQGNNDAKPSFQEEPYYGIARFNIIIPEPSDVELRAYTDDVVKKLIASLDAADVNAIPMSAYKNIISICNSTDSCFKKSLLALWGINSDVFLYPESDTLLFINTITSILSDIISGYEDKTENPVKRSAITNLMSVKRKRSVCCAIDGYYKKQCTDSSCSYELAESTGRALTDFINFKNNSPICDDSELLSIVLSDKGSDCFSQNILSVIGGQIAESNMNSCLRSLICYFYFASSPSSSNVSDSQYDDICKSLSTYKWFERKNQLLNFYYKLDVYQRYSNKKVPIADTLFNYLTNSMFATDSDIEFDSEASIDSETEYSNMQQELENKNDKNH